MAGALYLADSNILLRLAKRDHPEYRVVRSAVKTLHENDIQLAYTLQNLAEFWNASTRPANKNGFGLSIEETENNAREIERSFMFLPDNDAVFREWRRIVFRFRVSGVQVHDARIAASMYAHGIAHILTFNGSDFTRFTAISAIHPNSVLPNEVIP